MKSYIFAKDVLSEKHIGSLVHVKEVFHSKSGKVICKEFDNCIILNIYKGLMLKCCIFLSNCEHLIYDLDSENIFLYIAFPEDCND